MEADLKLGSQSEYDTLNVIKEYINPGYQKITDTYHPYDYQFENNYIELKTRRNASTKYPTTMIGFNKIKYAQERPNCNFKFLFRFTDGYFYYDFKHDNHYSSKRGGRSDRGRLELNDYCYIPINLLKKLF